MTTTTLPTQTHIAPHLREPVFRAYEPLIAQAVRAWPTETSFGIPPGIAPTTFVANFRNAILSLRQYKWETSQIDCEKMWSMGRSFVISQDQQGLVWFRARGTAGRPNTLMSEVRQHAPNVDASISLVPWRDTTGEEISALCLLINNKRLTGPVFIQGKVDEGLVDSLQGTYDVGIVYDEREDKTVIH